MYIMCFTAPTQCFQVFYVCACQGCCARFRDVVHVSEMLCTSPSSCARCTEVANLSQKLGKFHKPPNNVRVQLHWGEQTRSPDIYIYKSFMYICISIYIYTYFRWLRTSLLPIKKMPCGVIFCNNTRPSSPWTSAHFQRRGRNAQLDAAGQSWEVLPLYP